MARPSKSEALKGVPIQPIEETVDRAMEYLPRNLDLASEENRTRIRNWMVRICSVAIEQASRDFQRAAASAIQESAALSINPAYYADRKKRRTKYKAMKALRQNTEAPKTRAQVQFERLNTTGVKM